jgi:Zn-dependent protease
MSTAALIILGFAVIAIMSMVLHEYAHGYVAAMCGDYTAASMGRLTLNPIKHIDPFMTILLPAALILMHTGFVFGGAKPVPVNPYHFRHYRRDSRMVSAAGVTTNLMIAIALTIILRLLLATEVFASSTTNPSPLVIILAMGIFFNLVLFVFNLLPIPPLDGSRILRSFLSAETEALFNQMDRYGLILLFVFLWYVGFEVVFMAVYWLWAHLLQLDPAYLGAALRAWGDIFGR